MTKKFNLYDNDEFEDKLIYNLAFEKNFLDDIIQIIEPEYFNGVHRRWVVKHIKDLYDKHSKPITYQTVLIAAKDDPYFESDDKKGELSNIIRLSKKLSYEHKVMNALEDKEEVQEYAQKFCKTKKYVNAIQDCARLVGTNDEEKIPQIIADTEVVVDPIHVGTDYFDMQSRKEDEPRVDIIPTPWKALNDYIGGVGKNELIAWVAGMGSGKSTFASNIALYAMSLGFNVVLYTLELGEAYNRARIDSIMMGEKSEVVKDNYIGIEERIKEYKKNGGTLTIKKFGTGITVNTIKNHFKRLTARNKKPDLFIIDYIDLMDSVHDNVNRKQEWEKLGEITKEIRNELSFKENVAGHVFIQGNTTAISEFVIRADSSSGGARRLFPADGVLGIARPIDLKAQEKLNLSIIKSRFGEDGFYMRGDTDYSIGHIKINEEKYYNMHEDETLHTQNSIKEDYQKYKKVSKLKTQASTHVKREDDFEL